MRILSSRTLSESGMVELTIDGRTLGVVIAGLCILVMVALYWMNRKGSKPFSKLESLDIEEGETEQRQQPPVAESKTVYEAPPGSGVRWTPLKRPC